MSQADKLLEMLVPNWDTVLNDASSDAHDQAIEAISEKLKTWLATAPDGALDALIQLRATADRQQFYYQNRLGKAAVFLGLKPHFNY